MGRERTRRKKSFFFFFVILVVLFNGQSPIFSLNCFLMGILNSKILLRYSHTSDLGHHEKKNEKRKKI